MHGKKIINNSLISVVYKVIILLLGFMTRKIFIVYLGEEILGLNSLYANFLDLLNLADLGIGVAVQYQLYEPLVKNDTVKLSAIMTASKKIYNTIGFFVLIAGSILSFFVQYLIKETTYPIWFVRISFDISVIGIALGYFFVHKRLFLQADEELGLINIIDLIAKLITVVASLVSTVIFKNYFVYLIINALYGMMANIIIHFVFQKRYPYIKSNMKETHDETRKLTSNLKNVIPMKLSNYVYNSTDNMIISKVLGLTTVALYSNYITIINGIMGVEYLLGNVITSSIGKIIKEESNSQKVYKYYLEFQYVQYMFTNFCTVSLVALATPFITFWIGNKFVIQGTAFTLLVIDFFIHSMYQPAYVMYGAAGKFKSDKYVTLASAIMNIVVSIILVHVIGLEGVIFGTIITDIYVWIVRSYQMVRGYFNQNIIKYFLRMLRYTGITLISIAATVWLCSYVSAEHLLLEIIMKACVCICVPNAISILLTFWNIEFGFLVNYLKKHFRKGMV